MQPAKQPDETTRSIPESDDIQLMSPPVRLFKPKGKYKYTLPHPDYDDGKSCKVRFPTDEEWCRRQRTQVTISKSLGRDGVTQETKGENESNFELFNNIRLDVDGKDPNPGPAFDDNEATIIIDLLSQCTINEVSRQANQYKITMIVAGNVAVTHLLNIPTQKQVMEFGKVSVHSISKRGGRETRVMLEPSANLWQKLYDGTTGYPDDQSIPIIHKEVALTQVLLQIQEDFKGGVDPED